MFLDALRELDRNTERYMVEELNKEVNALKESIAAEKEAMAAEKEAMAAKNEAITAENEAMAKRIAELEAQLHALNP